MKRDSILCFRKERAKEYGRTEKTSWLTTYMRAYKIPKRDCFPASRDFVPKEKYENLVIEKNKRIAKLNTEVFELGNQIRFLNKGNFPSSDFVPHKEIEKAIGRRIKDLELQIISNDKCCFGDERELNKINLVAHLAECEHLRQRLLREAKE